MFTISRMPNIPTMFIKNVINVQYFPNVYFIPNIFNGKHYLIVPICTMLNMSIKSFMF